jgi:shikimate dehydrogenase
MKTIDDYRKTIDELDEKIKKLLEKRFDCTKAIGKLKRENHLEVTNSKREQEILTKLSSSPYGASLQEIYKEIFMESKKGQLGSYLVGKSLSYSPSVKFHQDMGNPLFQKKEITSLNDFIQTNDFSFLCVTNPFKKEAYSLCQEVTPMAEKTKVVNFIQKIKGKLIGDNLDVQACLASFQKHSLDFHEDEVIILGNGATSSTMQEVIQIYHPKSLKVFARHPKNNEYPFEKLKEEKNATVLIDATSYGVKPNLALDAIANLSLFPNLRQIFSVNYNPLTSSLALSARKQGINFLNGLEMLYNNAYFSEKKANPNLVSLNQDEYLNQYQREHTNLVFYGMPFSGKTTIGRLFAETHHQLFFDVDEILAERHESLKELLDKNASEQDFRDKEKEVIKDLACHQEGCVISLGGGSILQKENEQYLRQNGILIYLSTNLTSLENRIDFISRPLIQSKEDLVTLFQARFNQYATKFDIIIDANKQIELVQKEIEEKVNAYFHHPRS